MKNQFVAPKFPPEFLDVCSSPPPVLSFMFQLPHWRFCPGLALWPISTASGSRCQCRGSSAHREENRSPGVAGGAGGRDPAITIFNIYSSNNFVRLKSVSLSQYCLLLSCTRVQICRDKEFSWEQAPHARDGKDKNTRLSRFLVL